jgi:hypothetical protein
MQRYDKLVAAYDDYAVRSGFDPVALTRLLAELSDFFPRLFPIEATVRIDFVIVRADAAVLARISFSVRGLEFSISQGEPPDLECDQEIIVPEAVWLETLCGKVLRRDLFSLCVNRQLKPFRLAVAGLRYFISYYFDFGDISPWLRVSERGLRADNLAGMRSMRAELAPRFLAPELVDEYKQAN